MMWILGLQRHFIFVVIYCLVYNTSFPHRTRSLYILLKFGSFDITQLLVWQWKFQFFTSGCSATYSYHTFVLSSKI
jgi:hypothetical protein